ncbi:epididymal secretory protein E1-like protein [Dinothrombium tinctorium]|uniref:Epididymal secretory protein E1-like protein n=1 Tax=Dinothrombium tinctorium TaxID=1965070 RepID=A0A3S3Q258_9ACAR|nr:epididymal secretory protein E1-like protein [Dinothrombium tinctorium]RWS02041.1 epididymal secretory protein E1-like protein [Dinothrombium tinctorium]
MHSFSIKGNRELCKLSYRNSLLNAAISRYDSVFKAVCAVLHIRYFFEFDVLFHFEFKNESHFQFALHFFRIDFTKRGNGEAIALHCDVCERDPCELVKGKKAKIEFHFVPSYETVTFGAAASVFGFDMDLPVDDPVACSKYIECPLKPGKVNVFKYDLDIDESYPSMSVNVKLNLKSGNEHIACASTSISIVDSEDVKPHDEF